MHNFDTAFLFSKTEFFWFLSRQEFVCTLVQHERVEKYVKTFSSWIPYEHRVLGEVRDVNGTDRVVPIPPNIGEKMGE
jgi:hypothetical protein